MERWTALAVLLGLACSAGSIRTRVSAREFALVQEGRYPGSVRIKNGDPELERLVKDWRAELEAEPGFMRQVAEKYFALPEPSPFHFMYVGEDSVQGRVLLRYFAYDPHPVIMAGWQILFVFDRQSRRLAEVFTSEVPLE